MKPIQVPLNIGSETFKKLLINSLYKTFGWSFDVCVQKWQELYDTYLKDMSPTVSAVIECDYVDKVYRNSYYRYYAAKSHNISRDCIRLSFFNDANNDLLSQEMELSKWRSLYSGFLIIRPTTMNLVGRNGLAPFIFIDNDFLICKTQIPASVNGLKVSVEAFPASSQDCETMLCAETSVWALMEYFGNRYAEYTPVLPSQIIKHLRNWIPSRQLPSEGLSWEQISFLLKKFNFQPVVFPVGDKVSRNLVVGSYIESGIPICLVLNNSNYCNSNPQIEDIAHAVICIGHTKISEEAINNAVAEDYGGYSIVDYNDIEKKYVFIDDNFHPYQMDYLDAPTERYEDEAWKHCEIELAIVPLYEKILLSPITVKNIATNYILLCGQLQQTEIAMRIFLASSRSYRDYVCTNDMPETMKNMILKLRLPKFVWVVELSDRDLLRKEMAAGLMLFDATEPKFENLTALEMIFYNERAILISRDSFEPLVYDKVGNSMFHMYNKNLR